ncbi:MAG: pirin family protein [Dokdonella sp.]
MPDSTSILIEPRTHDIGALSVRRLLPHLLRRSVGPFVFFDHIGPADLAAGTGIDVRPHPHIGLATVTYLFDGALTHHDSLGFDQVIRPGDVNWMTAGRGIVHSERTPPAERASGHSIHGIQTWIALPQEHEETAPAFHHHAAATLPEFVIGDVRLRLIAGRAFDHESPVGVFSDMCYLAAEFGAGAQLVLPTEYAERGVHVARGEVTVDGQVVTTGQMLVLPSGSNVTISVQRPAIVVLFGGAAIDGPRHLWWNFVSSSRERIELAKRDWSEGNFAAVPGETEFIPLPEK